MKITANIATINFNANTKAIEIEMFDRGNGKYFNGKNKIMLF